MKWTVNIPKRVGKQIQALPDTVQETVLLVADMQDFGPVQGAWPNYSKLGATQHHCHIKKGKPCYVAVWEVTDKKIRLIEVRYGGTHENTHY